MSKEIILITDDRAATYMTNIKGWVDSNGMFYGHKEDVARYSGCTHRLCEGCNQPVEKHYLRCRDCRLKKSVSDYYDMPKLKWDGKIPLYSETHQEYFFDESDLYDYLHDSGCIIESLCLIICRPQYFSQIDTDYFYDDLPEDHEVPEEICIALDQLNKVIDAQGVASWYPGKFAADLSLTNPKRLS